MRIQLNVPLNFEKDIKEKMGTEIHCSQISDTCIAYMCPKCGAEIYGLWKIPFSGCNKLSESEELIIKEYEDVLVSNYKKEVLKVLEMKECPLCGSNLSREFGFYIAWCAKYSKCGLNYETQSNILTKPRNIEEIFETMERQRNNAEKKSADNRINSLISQSDIPSISIISTEDKEKIKNSSEKLKEYILCLIKMEINIYALTQRLENIYFRANKDIRQANSIKYFPLQEKREKITELEKFIEEYHVKLKDCEEGKIGIQHPVPPTQPIYKTPNIFNKKKILAENEEIEKKYQEDIQIYKEQQNLFEIEKERIILEVKEELQNKKEEINKLKGEIETSIERMKMEPDSSEIEDIILKEISEAEDLLKKSYECRNSLYSYGIVFEKYRNVVALSTFYEYLMAGRCTTLEGTDGAYNIYEAEIRADRIIGQLSQVIQKLDEIKESQFMIYSELQAVNKNLSDLNKTMDEALISIKKISENTDIIAYNSAVTACYSKLNAELTNSLGFMMALK